MSFDQTIACCGAPALCGLKPACLFSMSTAVFQPECMKIQTWNTELAEENKEIVAIRRSENLILLFVYDKKQMEHQFSGDQERAYLAQKGYPASASLSVLLAELLHRLSGESQFPHEVGLFLGYPLEDVIAFELHGGRDYKYSGYWKVYNDVDTACSKIAAYRECSKRCMDLVTNGVSVPRLTKMYQGNR
jgi:hypothetical protein